MMKQQLLNLGARRLTELLLQEAADNTRLQEGLLAAVGASRKPCENETERTASLDEPEPHLVGNSEPMRAVYVAIRKYAATDAPVLITGKSGTGKELAANAIHERSRFSAGPFMPINCGGIPHDLIASELFGHEKGSFTGADRQVIGRIEAAEGGTVFLDEIGDLPIDLQANLLRFLQDGTVDRIGGTRPNKVDVRIIAATNVQLETAIAQHRFREDLFYRLNVLNLEMPPLQSLGDDIDLMSLYFLRTFAAEMNQPIRGFEDDVMSALHDHQWPGNVRELISCIRRAVVVTEGERISVSDLGLPNPPRSADIQAVMPHGGARAPVPTDSEIPLGRAKQEFEASLIREALGRHQHNVKQTAEHLGVSRVTLHRLIKKYELPST